MTDDLFGVPGSIEIPYRWFYGETLSRFFEGTWQKKIYGSRCPFCKGVIVPRTRICGRCFAPTEPELIELPHTGRLEAFTVVYLPFPGQPKEPPYAIVHILIGGSDTSFMHLVGECDFEEIECDMRVEAVWNPEPKGNLYDILHGMPVR